MTQKQPDEPTFETVVYDWMVKASPKDLPATAALHQLPIVEEGTESEEPKES